jgi:hypothetical protein
MQVEILVVGDDCALPHRRLVGRRGIAGTVLVHKVRSLNHHPYEGWYEGIQQTLSMPSGHCPGIQGRDDGALHDPDCSKKHWQRAEVVGSPARVEVYDNLVASHAGSWCFSGRR